MPGLARKGSRGIALLILNLDAGWGCERHVLAVAVLPPTNSPGAHSRGG
jgi:hypothetical protein